jgi:hypothetical protein
MPSGGTFSPGGFLCALFPSRLSLLPFTAPALTALAAHYDSPRRGLSAEWQKARGLFCETMLASRPVYSIARRT